MVAPRIAAAASLGGLGGDAAISVATFEKPEFEAGNSPGNSTVFKGHIDTFGGASDGMDNNISAKNDSNRIRRNAKVNRETRVGAKKDFAVLNHKKLDSKSHTKRLT